MKISELQEKANQLRADVLTTVTNAGSGHPGGALGMADVMTALHYNFLNDCPPDGDWSERDRFILSNGHTCPLLYAILADRGYFSKEELASFRKLGAVLQGHPSVPKHIPGVEFSSGSLGHGLSFASGIALSNRIDGRSNKVYCSISDAECQEGQTWEAAGVARHQRIGNLCALVDYNDSQIDGPVSKVLDVSPLREKWESFGWRVTEIDGHDYEQINSAFQSFLRHSEPRTTPTVIICRNILGKGVSFMEGDHHWHHGTLSEKQLSQAFEELGVSSQD